MKRFKIFSKALCLAVIMAFILTPISVFAAEEESDKKENYEHNSHVDVTGDGLCDIEDCGEMIHSDVNGDGKCDIKGCNACVIHKDENGDGVCDTEDCGMCLTHLDENGDEICDREGCGAKTEAENSVWQNVLESLKVFIIGMIGIFVVVGIIILVIYALMNAINGTKQKPNGEQ